jgi:hypothetical protein
MFCSVYSVSLLFCVLFVCKFVLDYCHQDIRPLFDYRNRFFYAFSSVVRQMPGCNSQRQGTAHTSHFFVLLCVLFFVLCVLFVRKCVLYYCHWVSTQFQLKINNNNNN